MIRLEVKNCNMMLTKKLYHLVLALPSGKIDKYEYLTGEKMLTSDQSWVIEQAKFTYSSLGRALEKPKKTIEDAAKK